MDVDFQQEKAKMSNLYLVYELLTLMSTIYSKAYSAEYSNTHKSTWNQCLDLVIDDVESIHEVWQLSQDELDSGLPLQEDAELNRRSFNLRKRFFRVQKLVHHWFLLRRLPRLLLACEAKISQLLADYLQTYPFDSEILNKIRRRGSARVK